jgi:outer membrane protein OmpA-like peptidoglycan-associated protein
MKELKCQFDSSLAKQAALLSLIIFGCTGGATHDSFNTDVVQKADTSQSIVGSFPPLMSENKRIRIKLGHAVNTAANEYLPVLSPDEKTLYFSGMDRTGFFDFKLDFTKEKSSGGEDVFMAVFKEGIWEDARPLVSLNTNGHEVVTHAPKEGKLMVTGNYPENLGASKDKDAGVQTTDLFLVRNFKSNQQIFHFPEPVNSIYTEADGVMAVDESYVLFVSDRPGHVGDYHKKGWKWNGSFWGNTDVYVSLKEGDYWSVPINLGKKVNTAFAERTPWLSADGLTLFLSSNGYDNGKTDLDVYAFKRKDRSKWTEWEGPFVVEDANTPFDDWGYKETSNGTAFVASANKLGFEPTQGGAAGDGGIRETNYRPGYEVYGLQVAALNKSFEMNIYQLQSPDVPSFVLSDLYFDFNSFAIKKSFEKHLFLLIDQINQNKPTSILIDGHTDDIGDLEYNRNLSLKRAEAIKSFLMKNGVDCTFVVNGFGSSKPILPNINAVNRAMNRRVEINLKFSTIE